MWSPVKQLLRVAHPVTSKKRLLAVLIAYFDESGKPDHRPVVSLAAVVASNVKWRRFEVDWMSVLRKYDMPKDKTFKKPFFHMTDFESNEVEPYKNWSRDKKVQCIAELTGIINRTITFGSVHSLVVDDWNEVIAPYLNQYEKRRGWYVFLLQCLLAEIKMYVEVPSYETIACVFDTNNEVSYAAKEHYDGLKEYWGWQTYFGSASYESSVQFCPLQAGDILAYEGRKDTHNIVIDAKKRPRRKLLNRLAENGRVRVMRYEKDGLLKFKDDWMECRAFLARQDEHN